MRPIRNPKSAVRHLFVAVALVSGQPGKGKSRGDATGTLAGKNSQTSVCCRVLQET